MKILFEQINDGTLPDQPGEYMTDHGNLQFSVEQNSFIVKGGVNRPLGHKTTINWWLKQQLPEKKTKKWADNDTILH